MNYLDPAEAVQAIDRAAERHKGRRKPEPEPEWTVEPTPTSLRREKAQEKAQRPGSAPDPALARTTRRPGGVSSPPSRLVRDLSDDELAEIRSQSAAKIVRPHRKPWEPPQLDLADLPCVCSSRGGPCALHALELGGTRPYAR